MSDPYSTPQSHKRTQDGGFYAGDEGHITKSQRLDPDRLDDILEDFDAEGKYLYDHDDRLYIIVEARIQKIRVNAKLCADRLKRDLDIKLMGLNTIIRKMTVKEFREKYNEDVDLVMRAESNDLLHTKNQILSRISSIHTSTATMSTPRKQTQAPPTYQVHQTFTFKTPSKTPRKIVYATPNRQSATSTISASSTQAVSQPTPITTMVRSRKNRPNQTKGPTPGIDENKENLSSQNKNPLALIVGTDKFNIHSPTAKQKLAQDPSALQELLKFQEELKSILSAVNNSSSN